MSPLGLNSDMLPLWKRAATETRVTSKAQKSRLRDLLFFPQFLTSFSLLEMKLAKFADRQTNTIAIHSTKQKFESSKGFQYVRYSSPYFRDMYCTP